MLTAAQLKLLLASHGLRLTKRLGQHHLIDERIINRIIAGCPLSRADTVVEIGAGLGALTEPLAQRAGRVIAIEVDRRVCALLQERMARQPNVTVVHEDILRWSWERHPGAVVVGAIPYVLTSPIFLRLCEGRRDIREAVLLLQQEVAQRLIARPGTKAYGRLSVLSQYCWNVKTLLAVPRNAFFPPPAVDSVCLRFTPLPRSHWCAPVEEGRTVPKGIAGGQGGQAVVTGFTPWDTPRVTLRDEPMFFALVKAAFGHRRKTLVNCLEAAGLIRRAELDALLRALRLPPSVRGEALSLEQFAALADAVYKK